jgi:hypothetical protein
VRRLSYHYCTVCKNKYKIRRVHAHAACVPRAGCRCAVRGAPRATTYKYNTTIYVQLRSSRPNRESATPRNEFRYKHFYRRQRQLCAASARVCDDRRGRYVDVARSASTSSAHEPSTQRGDTNRPRTIATTRSTHNPRQTGGVLRGSCSPPPRAEILYRTGRVGRAKAPVVLLCRRAPDLSFCVDFIVASSPISGTLPSSCLWRIGNLASPTPTRARMRVHR